MLSVKFLEDECLGNTYVLCCLTCFLVLSSLRQLKNKQHTIKVSESTFSLKICNKQTLLNVSLLVGCIFAKATKNAKKLLWMKHNGQSTL